MDIDVNKNIKKAIKDKGHTLKGIAHILGINPVSMSYNLDEGKHPRIDTILKYADLLDISVSEMIGDPRFNGFTTSLSKIEDADGNINVNKSIKASIKTKGYTLRSFAEVLGISDKTLLYNLEDRNRPRIDTILKYADLLDMSVSEMIGDPRFCPKDDAPSTEIQVPTEMPVIEEVEVAPQESAVPESVATSQVEFFCPCCGKRLKLSIQCDI